ncbi:MAG: anthranilate synthase component II [Phycisphaerales bacterium JB037]
MILLVDNYDSFTWNLVQRLGELDPSLRVGEDLVVVRNDAVTPDDVETINHGSPPTRLIISPGPCTPAEAGVSSAMIERFAGRIPILGVCLGHQCIGDLHGMTVARHRVPVHGKTSPIHHDSRGVFAGIPSPTTATRYHSLVILADSIPPPPEPGHDGWEISAWTDEPGEVVSTPGPGPDAVDDHAPASTIRVVMGLRRVWADPDKAPLEGVQFHPESFMTEDGPKMLANFLGLAPAPV